MDMDMRIEGMDDFINTIDRMVKGMHPDKVEPVLNKGAAVFTKAAKETAPIGPTGNLKKAIKTKKLRRYYGNPAPSIAAIDRKKAPHAHLVIYGARGGRMPPNHFWHRAFYANKDKVLSDVANELGRNLEEAMRK